MRSLFNSGRGNRMKKLTIYAVILLVASLLIFGCAGTKTATLTPEKSKRVESVSETADTLQPIVIYDSWSGNTKNVAEVIAHELRCDAVFIDDATKYDMNTYNLIIIGSPVHSGMPTKKIKQFLSRVKPTKYSAVFVTYGAPGFGPLTAKICLNYMEGKLGDTSIGRFKCHGFHHILKTYPDHPNADDAKEAISFASDLAKKCVERL
jgi:flavodoxin